MIHLTRTDPTRNMARFYVLDIATDPVRRVGAAPGMGSDRQWPARVCRFASEQEAALAMAEHLKAKLSKGYEAV